jgi:hypothetical protein
LWVLGSLDVASLRISAKLGTFWPGIARIAWSYEAAKLLITVAPARRWRSITSSANGQSNWIAVDSGAQKRHGATGFGGASTDVFGEEPIRGLG